MRLPGFFLTLTLAFCSVIGPAAAEDVVVSNFKVWSSVNGTDFIRVQTRDPKVNPGFCSDPDSYFVSTATSKEVQARVFAVLLNAKAISSPLGLRISGCEQNRPAILDAWAEAS